MGRALPEHEVKIVDDLGRELGERTVGRLAFRGPSMTSGYYRKPEATAAMTLADGFLDSGDLAYVAEGEIYITGRRKDLIIKGGRNLVPQEIEEAAAAVPGIRRGCVVAFGLAHPETGHRAPGGGRGDPGPGRGRARPSRARGHRAGGGGGGGAARRRGPGAAGRRPQDILGQGPPRRDQASST